MGIRQMQECPVCGHKRWCSVFTGSDAGSEFYCCHYLDGQKGDKLIGADGREYILVKPLKDGDGWTVQTVEQKEEAERKWKEEHPLPRNIFPTCPVCGKRSTCGWYPAKKSYVPDAKTIICVSQKGPAKSLVTGVDGKKYRIFLESSDKSGWLLESYEQYRENIRLWKDRKFSEDTADDKAPINEPKQSIVKQIQYASKGKDVPSKLLPNEKLDKAYRHIISMLHLIPEHREILLEAGWTDELIKKHNIVSMPLSDKKRWELEKSGVRNTDIQKLPWRNAIVKSLQEQIGEDLTGIPGFYCPETCDRSTGEIVRKWRMAGGEGMLFFMTDIKGQYFGAQIRLDHPTNKGKYMAWSTNPNSQTQDGKQCYPGGTGLPSQAGLIYNPERDQSYVAYITEGYKKGMIGNELLKAPFIPLPGVNQFGTLITNPDPQLNVIDFLKKQGTKIFVVAYDADKAVNENVLKQEGRVIEFLKELGFQVMVADWTQHGSRFKGLDDLLLAGLRPEFQLVK